MAEARIFISMGTPYTDASRAFRDQLEEFLRDQCGLNPRIIGKNEYPDGSPLAKIRDVMARCHGVIIVAYERKFVESGVEKRGADAAKPIAASTFTTPWNHIESAMAYSLGLPIYILCEEGLTEEGLIEDKIDWYVQKVAIDPTVFSKTSVTSSLKSWVEQRVIPLSKRPRMIRTIEGNLKLSEMTPKEIIGAISVSFPTV